MLSTGHGPRAHLRSALLTAFFLVVISALLAQGAGASAGSRATSEPPTVPVGVKPLISAPPAPPYSPGNSLIFNNPRGTKAQQLAIITAIDKSIDGAPAKSTIRMAQYLFDIDSTANKLIAAHKRGVNVQVLIDDGNVTKQSQRVKKALGSNKSKLSFVTTCKHSCMSNSASVMHAKFYLFSMVGKSAQVSMISSANPYTGNTFTSWNNMHTIVGDTRIYASLTQYFNDMIQDKNDSHYYRTTASGKYLLYLFPGVPTKKVHPVVILEALKHVACLGAAPGYGSNGRTVIRVAMWGWTAGRIDIAKKLQSLQSRGCKVEVILNSGRTNPLVLRALLKRSPKYGAIAVYDAWVDKNHNGLPELYMHHKLVTIKGKWYGHAATKVTYTGSQNFSAPATLANNDIVLRILDNGVYNAYGKNLDYIRALYTKRITRVPYLSSSVAESPIDRLVDSSGE